MENQPLISPPTSLQRLRQRSGPWDRADVPRFAPWGWFSSSASDESSAFPFISPREGLTVRMARVEAVLFVAPEAMTVKKIMQLAMLADLSETRTLIEQLNRLYDAAGSAMRIESIAGGYRMMSRPELATWLDRLSPREAVVKLSPPVLETLAVVAYRQPVTRAEVESIRGVQCIDLIKQLMETGFVRIAGEDNSLGRPFLYETTRKFLETYGLSALNDLPNADALRSAMTGAPPQSGAA